MLPRTTLRRRHRPACNCETQTLSSSTRSNGQGGAYQGDLLVDIVTAEYMHILDDELDLIPARCTSSSLDRYMYMQFTECSRLPSHIIPNLEHARPLVHPSKLVVPAPNAAPYDCADMPAEHDRVEQHTAVSTACRSHGCSSGQSNRLDVSLTYASPAASFVPFHHFET